MRTQVVTLADPNSYATALQEAAIALRDGALVVFPTETVYGIAANAADAKAVARLRELKQRTGPQPFTVHIARRSDARRYLPSPSPFVRRFARKAWAGPLTMVCTVSDPREAEIAEQFPPEQLKEIFFEGTVGLRCPDHAAAARLIGEAGVPVVASSANRAGMRPAVDAESALREFDGAVAYIIDAGRSRLGAPSTIVAVNGNDWSIRRQGAIAERVIQRMAVSEVLFLCTGNSCRSPLAEYLFRHKLAEKLALTQDELVSAGYRVSSAGTFALLGGSASSGTLEELKKRGIDGGAHASQPLTVELIQRAERIFAMTSEHRHAVLGMVPAAADRVQMLDSGGPVADPIGGGAAEYGRCAEHIERAVERRVEEFVDEDSHW